MQASIVIPTRNEVGHIGGCVQSVTDSMGVQEMEIIVAEGMSTDGTPELLMELGKQHRVLRVIHNRSGLTSVGLNAGIRSATASTIVIVGGHCKLAPDYIQKVVAHLIADPTAGCAGGRTVIVAEGGWVTQSVGAALSSPFGVGNSAFRVGSGKARYVDTVAYGAYRREVFDKVGLFDERLIRNQDIEFNYRLRKAGYRILFDPSAEVYYTPRRSLRAFWHQNFGNGYWNVITWRLVPGSLSWRHFVPLVFVGSLLLSAFGARFLTPAGLLFRAIVGAYLLADVLESVRIAFRRRSLCTLGTLLVFPVLHVSYGLGSVWGIVSVILGREKALKTCSG